MPNPKDFPFLLKFISHVVRVPEGGPRVEKLMAAWLQDPGTNPDDLEWAESSAKTLSDHPAIFAYFAVNGNDAGEEWKQAGIILGYLCRYLLSQVSISVEDFAFAGGDYLPDDGLPDIW